MYGLIAIASVGVLASTILLTSQINLNEKPELVTKEQATIQNAQDLANCNSVFLTKEKEGTNQLFEKNILPSKLLVYNKNVELSDGVKLNKYYKAVDAWMENHINDDEISCISLGSTGIITVADCISIVNNPAIKLMEVSSSSVKMDISDTELEGDYGSELTLSFPNSKIAERKERITGKLKKEFNQAMLDKDYETAAKISVQTGRLNPNLSLSQGNLIVDRVTEATEDGKITTDQTVNVQELLAQATDEIVRIKTLSTESVSVDNVLDKLEVVETATSTIEASATTTKIDTLLRDTSN
jgi:hypothetical protein